MTTVRKFLAMGVALLVGVVAVMAVQAAEVDTQKRLFDREQLQVHTGVALVNSATADYSKWQPLVTIAPDSQHALYSCRVVLDLGLATTGFGAVYTSGTITATVQRKVDGTNWRNANNLATATVTGTLAGATGEQLSIDFDLSSIGPTEGARIAIRISSVSNTNVSIPYVVYYRAGSKATFTPAS